MYVHPDKNPNDKERADIAFEGNYFIISNELGLINYFIEKFHSCK